MVIFLISGNPSKGTIEIVYMDRDIPSIAVGVRSGKVHGLYNKEAERQFFERVKTRGTNTFETADDAFGCVTSFAFKGYEDIEIFGGAKEQCVAGLAVHALNHCFENVIIPKRYTFSNVDSDRLLEDVVRKYFHDPFFYSENADFYCLSRKSVAQIPAFLLC